MSREATDSARAPGKPTRAKMLVQVVGFILGCVLIGWCIQRAWKDGGEGLAKLRAAERTSAPAHAADEASSWPRLADVMRGG